LAGFLLGCAADPTLSSIQVSPQVASAGAGASTQFTALALYTQGRHPQTTRDVTDQVTWTSSNAGVATISATGVATAINAGTTSISATMNGSFGPISATADLTVTAGTGLGSTLTGITIIPVAGSQTVYALGETAQFLAIGNYSSSPTTQDLTGIVSWGSVDVNVATINASGLATAVSCSLPSPPCVTTITASTTLGNGTVVVATSSLGVFPDVHQSNLPSLTVYPVGRGSGTVTSSPVGITCGAGASCTADFVLNSSVTLTANATSGFVIGFSSNCQPDAAPPNATTATCTVTMGGNQTVGVIFNAP
jgi:hypothetical protein